MYSWKMLLLAPLGAVLLGCAAPAEAGDRRHDRSDARVEQRFTDGRDWRHGDNWHRDNRWDRRDRRDWQKDEWRSRQHARDRRAWERRAENLDRYSDILRKQGRFRDADRLERQARQIDRRSGKWDRRGDGRRHGGGIGPFIRWNSF